MIAVKPVILSLLVVTSMVPAQSAQKFTGIISDSMCPAGNHSGMRMGPTDAECTIGCNDAHGAPYVLYDGKDTYTLSDQKTPSKFAGRKVTVTGTLYEKTGIIKVEKIEGAK